MLGFVKKQVRTIFTVLSVFSISVGSCDFNGAKTQTYLGECICNSNFEGPQCKNCITGYAGSYCDMCALGFHKVYYDCYGKNIY